MLSRYVDAIMIRCFSHQQLLDLASHATVPVINGLTERSHPCQIMADLQTMIDCHGPLKGQSVTWLGDGNNVLVSWIEAAVLFKFELAIACPNNYPPSAELLSWAERRAVTSPFTMTRSSSAKQPDAGYGCVDFNG